MVLYASDDNRDLIGYGGKSAPGYVAETAALLYAAPGFTDQADAAIEYIRNGHNIIYGSAGDDVLSAASGKGDSFDPGLPSYFVAGSGNDVITPSLVGDVIYGGTGNDTFVLSSTGATIYSGDGNDILSYLSSGDNAGIADGFMDASTTDSVIMDGHVLTGGQKVIITQDDTVDQLRSGDWFSLMNADDYAAYDIRREYDESGNLSDTMHLGMLGGAQLDITDFIDSHANISGVSSGRVFTTDIATVVPELKAIDLDPSHTGHFSVDNFAGLHRVAVNYVDPPPPMV